MKHFRKKTVKLVAVITLAAMLMSLFGCGPSEDPTSSVPQQEATDTTVTVGTGGDTVVTGDSSTSTVQAGTTTTGNGGSTPTTGKTPSTGTEIPSDLGKGTTYYISSSGGNDSNDGKSPAKAFRTVAPVNKLTLKAGDNVLFKRGDVFTGAYLKPLGAGTDNNWITIDAYGSGANPVLKNGSELKAAISFSSMLALGKFRVRNLDIDGYLAGIVSIKNGADVAFDGLLIENCNLRNITTNKPYGAVSSFPEQLDTAYGLYLEHIKNATIRNVTITSSDIPVRMYGVLTLFDNLTVTDSRVTGVMLFGAEEGATAKDVEATAGGIVVQNSRILYTGSAGLSLGTTGLMIENTKGCVIKNTEVGYTTNGTGDNDGCAVDWEQLNINCTLDNVYAHDNDGPFLLAMEHPETAGGSKGNKVMNCISVNNGKRNHTAEGSFINHSNYNNSYQKITVSNCIDVGIPGSVPYSYWGSTKKIAAELNSKYVQASGFTSGTMDVWNTFDQQGLENFKVTTGASVKDSRLSLSAKGQVLTNFSASDYIVSTWLKGKSELLFMHDGTSGYMWAVSSGKITAQKVTGGKTVTLKNIAVSGLNPDKWFRLRVEVSGGSIKTYVNDILVDTLKDSSFTSGSAGVRAVNSTLVDEFFVYRYRNSSRTVQSFTVNTVASGGDLSPNSSNGGWNLPEVKWQAGSGIGTYIYRPYGVAHADITGKNAYLQYNSMNVNVSGGYQKLNLQLVNATSSPTIYIDFSTDGGKTWHTKTVQVRHMTAEKTLPFSMLWPSYDNYVVDMSDMPQWTGVINGLRVRTEATSGFLHLKQVFISK